MAGALLGIDLGTSAVKAIICDDQMRVLGHGSAEHPVSQPSPGAAEQNPDDWCAATTSAVHQAIAEFGSTDIAAIGLTGQMHGAVFLDEANRTVMPAIIWADTRAGAEVEEITASLGQDRLIQITGSPLATGFQAATIKWVQRNHLEQWRRVAKVLVPKDYLRFLLSETIATEPSDASATLLLDVKTRRWATEMLSVVGIDHAMLPEIVPSDSITGTLTASAADQLGLSEGIPIVAGGGDAPIGAIGAGIVEPNRMLLTISTGAQALVPAMSPEIDPRGRMHTFCAALPLSQNSPGWYQMGATMVAGLAMRWLRDNVFALSPDEAYDEMTSWAAETPPGAGGLIFVPYLAGERTPHMNPNARGMFIGLTASHGRGHLVRAVMEGVTFALYDAFEVLKEVGASPIEAVLAGGGAKSKLWQQIVADVFDLPICLLRSAEQSAAGAALLAGAALHWFEADVSARLFARYGDPVEPSSPARDIYRELRPIYREAYQKHVADFDRLTEIDRNSHLVESDN